MTDNEIINGLECCVNKHKCKNCDFYKYDTCFVVREKEILDLINSQKAEIERLNGLLKENEKAFNKMTELYNKAFNRCKTTKAEARKEFAEKLESRCAYKLYEKHGKPTSDRAILVSDMHNLLAAMESERK